MAAALTESLRDFDPSTCPNDAERLQLVAAAKQLLAKTETPFEFIMEITHSKPMLTAGLKLAKDLHLFEKWHKAGGGAKTTAELAHMVGVSPSLLHRYLRHMVATNVLGHIDEDTFLPNKLTLGLTDPTINAWIQYMYELTLPLMLGLPEYFGENGYKEPNGSRDGIFQHVFKSPGRTLFDYLRDNPKSGQMFNDCMTGWGGHRSGWLDFYPSERLIDDTSNPVLVDVGGNVGHDLDLFLKKHPGIQSRLVIEDLPEVVSKATCDKAIKRVEHDFFRPQPIHGAKAYYMKTILHDWSDEHSIKILENLKPALKPGYSKVLINDVVIESTNPNWIKTGEDLAVMTIVSSLERSERQWRKVVEGAGLKLVKIWSSPSALESIIEVEA